MHHIFAAVIYRVTRFSPKCTENNW